MANPYFSGERPDRPHLVRGKGGVAGEVDDLRGDVDNGFDAVKADIDSISVGYLRTLHVGKHGVDTNDGKTPNSSFLTVGAAVIAATALTPEEDNPVIIVIVDGGKYEESVVLPTHVHLLGPLAKISAVESTVALTLDGGNNVQLREIEGAANQVACLRSNIAGPPATIQVQTMRVASGGSGFVNLEVATGAAFLVNCREVFLLDGSFAFGVIATTVGHIHLNVGDVYFDGDNSVGVVLVLGGSFVGTIDHIVDRGSGTNNKGLLASAGNMDLDVHVIVADIAYEIDGGVLNLKVNRIVGSRIVTSGSARVSISPYISTTAPGTDNDDVDTAALGQAFGPGDFWLDTTTTGTLYVCVSAATGAASWLQVS